MILGQIESEVLKAAWAYSPVAVIGVWVIGEFIGWLKRRPGVQDRAALREMALNTSELVKEIFSFSNDVKRLNEEFKRIPIEISNIKDNIGKILHRLSNQDE